MSYMLFFFFFKQKTAYELRISDWSSDVCSSDLGQARGEHRAAPDLKALLAALADAAHDDVFYRRRIDPRPRDDAIQHRARHVGRMPSGEPAAALAAGGAHRFNDIGFGHAEFSIEFVFETDRKSTRLNSSH